MTGSLDSFIAGLPQAAELPLGIARTLDVALGGYKLDDGLTLEECGVGEDACLTCTERPLTVWSKEVAVIEIGCDGAVTTYTPIVSLIHDDDSR